MSSDGDNKKTLGEEIRETLRIVIIALLVVIPIRLFVAQPFIVRGASMEPTFEDGEYLIVDEFSYRFSAPRRGEAIIFRFPQDPRQFFIKRIIGLPYETVTIEGGKILVGRPGQTATVLDESYLPTGILTMPDKAITLGGNEYFVMGDNRTNSFDSRGWGPLDRDLIVGRAFIRLLPVSRISLL